MDHPSAIRSCNNPSQREREREREREKDMKKSSMLMMLFVGIQAHVLVASATVMLLLSTIQVSHAFVIPSPPHTTMGYSTKGRDGSTAARRNTWKIMMRDIYHHEKQRQQFSVLSMSSSLSSSSSSSSSDSFDTTPSTEPGKKEKVVVVRPIFNFVDIDNNTTNNFDRIDDVVMGGISSSTLRQQSNEPFARWSGVCREDGGGFCGIRTLPFEKPLMVSGDIDDEQGIYIKCRFTSDDEPERRVWKVTTRTDTSRGEQLYQALIKIPKRNNDGKTAADDDNLDWTTIFVPFNTFQLVSGARLMTLEDVPTMNVTSGLYQIGMVMSKFTIAKKMTSIENFKPGYFELQLQEIGLYSSSSEKNASDDTTATTTTTTNNTTEVSMSTIMTTEEEPKIVTKRKLPLIFKLLQPIGKLFFTETSQRRKSAMRLLMEERGCTRLQAIQFGLTVRARRYGWIRSFLQTVSILVVDSLRRTVVSFVLYGLIKPIRFVRKGLLWILPSPKKEKTQE